MKTIIENSIMTSLINKEIQSDTKYHHVFINNSDNRKMVSELRRQLKDCEEFYFSIAFITKSGISMLKNELLEAQKLNKVGKIVAGLYLDFTEPSALEELNNNSNIDLRVSTEDGFHSKSYIFKKGDLYTIIIGSSNLTGSALAKNKEMNVRFTASSKSKVAEELLSDFDNEFQSAAKLDTILEEYKKRYMLEYKMRLLHPNLLKKTIVPNLMQKAGLEQLEVIRGNNEYKALLVSATGTGKTYFAAFDVLAYKPKRCLFLVHRENIARKAMESFQKIMPDIKMGLFIGNKRDDANYLFSTIQTISRDINMHNFSADYFDYIVIDEVHHVGAPTYNKIINYFKPKFLLGMTATPKRSDDFNVFEVFNHNIASEIHLKDAMKMDLLVPFRYFGVADLTIDGVSIDDKTNLNLLVAEKRMKHIVDKTQLYGCDSDEVKGLIFVSRVEEAFELVKKLKSYNVKAVALTGKDSEERREKIIKKLESGLIDYIITVDIFNEGIDIPCVNQVVLLRPTDSAIVYVQQIGRGLRKDINKKYLTIIDFIGNYDKLYNNIIALSQDRSGSKDLLKRFVKFGSDLLIGESTISFDQVSEERIFEALNRANFSQLKVIKDDYVYLKNKIGRMPLYTDFHLNQLISPVNFLNKRSYYDVLMVMKEDIIFNELEAKYLKYFEKYLTPAKRIHEVEIMLSLLAGNNFSIEEINEVIEEKYGLTNQINVTSNAILHLERHIFTSLSELKPYLPMVSSMDNKIVLDDNFYQTLLSNEFLRTLIIDLLQFNIMYYNLYYKLKGDEYLKLYGLYNKAEAHKYAMFDYSNGFQVSGYNKSIDQKEVIAFISLDDVSVFGSYDNAFVANNILPWYSKSKRVLQRNGELTLEGKIANGDVNVKLFCKKKTGEDFNYLGYVEEVLEAIEQKNDKGQDVVKYLFRIKDIGNEHVKDILT